jgi:aldehyde:ferredoxin oxidoreductase
MNTNTDTKQSGWHGSYLLVDVSTRQVLRHAIPPQVLRQFIGGSGIAAWLLHQWTDGLPGYDPLGPAAPLVFSFSPLVGSPLTTSAKFAVASRSPLTGCLNDSLSSSRFAISGKKNGVDAIVMTGQADSWLTVVIDDGAVQFVSAEELQGRSAAESTAALQSSLGPDFDVAAIGVAGEQQVWFATISHDRRHAGRGGSGAVLGSKKIKAICVRGTKRVSFAEPETLVAYSREVSRASLTEATAKYRETGTIINLVTFNRLGTLPTRNFQDTRFEGSGQLSPAGLQGSGQRIRQSCAACTIGCEHVFVSEDGQQRVRMEYESLYAFGPMCGISQPEIVTQAVAICDELGMDTISAGATIAFAMECTEAGLLPDSELRFGNGPAMLQCLRQIGERRGLGDLLAHGSRFAAREIGQGSAAWAPHVKGLEIPGYDPRSLQLMALGFAVGTRGADHNRSGAYEADFSADADRFQPSDADVSLAVQSENESALMDSLILCRFLRGVFDRRVQAMAEMLQLTTGCDYTEDELREAAARIVDVRKMFNIRHGWQPADDSLPPRMLDRAVSSGNRTDVMLTTERLQQLVKVYNRCRGWTDDGFLTRERHAVRRYELGLQER